MFLQSFLTNCLAEFSPIKKSVNLSVRAWVNISKPGGYLEKHHHPDCNLAGVLWIKAPKNCGFFYFESPNEFAEYDLMDIQKQEMVDQYLACPSYRIEPQEGLMVLFPSHLRHAVEMNQSDEDRISIAFNIDFRKINE